MAATNTWEPDVERSTDDIRRDIAKKEENLSRTVEQIGERIQEKLDWRGYVKDSPYWALGAVAGLGFLASGMFRTRTTGMERIINSVAGEVRDSLHGLRAIAAGPGLVKVTLLGLATKAAAGWLKHATSTAVSSVGAAPRPQAGRGSIVSPRAEIEKSSQIKH
jgi:hypothetical protein